MAAAMMARSSRLSFALRGQVCVASVSLRTPSSLSSAFRAQVCVAFASPKTPLDPNPSHRRFLLLLHLRRGRGRGNGLLHESTGSFASDRLFIKKSEATGRFMSSDSSDHKSKVEEALKILKDLEKKLPVGTETEKITGLEIKVARLEAHVAWGGVLIGIFGTIAIVLPGACYTTQNELDDAKTKQEDMGKTINILKDQVRLLELRKEMAAVLPTDAATSPKATEAVQLPTEDTSSTPPEPVKHLPSTPQTPWYRCFRFGI